VILLPLLSVLALSGEVISTIGEMVSLKAGVGVDVGTLVGIRVAVGGIGVGLAGIGVFVAVGETLPATCTAI